MNKIFVYHSAEDGQTVKLTNIEAARFFDNRDPNQWTFVRFEEPVVDPCPYCGTELRAKELWEGGGITCPNKDCNYWFCY